MAPMAAKYSAMGGTVTKLFRRGSLGQPNILPRQKIDEASAPGLLAAWESRHSAADQKDRRHSVWPRVRTAEVLQNDAWNREAIRCPVARLLCSP